MAVSEAITVAQKAYYPHSPEVSGNDNYMYGDRGEVREGQAGSVTGLVISL